MFLIIRHCRSLFADRINNALLEKIISSFIVISGTRSVFVGIDLTGFKMTHTSQYYTERTELRREENMRKGYDSEQNHLLVREDLHGFSVIPARYEHAPIWRTHGKYRKWMKRGYSKLLYNQRNKDETIMSVIKRLFGEI